MSKKIDRIAFELWAGIGSIRDLDAWAESELRSGDPHPDAHQLFNLGYEEAERQALRLADEIRGFSPLSEQSEAWARELLYSYCKKLLAGEIKPAELCRLVQFFDGGFLDARPTKDGTVYYPEWLGDLWNCCDWCDETWELDNSPYLVQEVRKVLQERYGAD